MNFDNNVTAYPQGILSRGTYWKSMYDTTILPYNAPYIGCSKNHTLCYTQSKGTSIYKPHSQYGTSVGRTSAGYLSQRRRL
jgi:hypothetical protein